MRIAEINILHQGSTGKIMLQIAQCAREKGHEVRTFSPIGFSFSGPSKYPNIPGHTYFGSYFSRGVHTICGILFGLNGLCSVLATQKLIREFKRFSPDLIHLHNLHQYCINLPILFRYIKKHKIRVIWTLHDCWSFTGRCAHFDYVGCQKWKTGCSNCPQPEAYPKSRIDNCSWMFRQKKKWFDGVNNLTIVTPSQWLAGLVKESFLSQYPVKVINNGIDLEIFKPTKGDFRSRYACEDKKILLGVAFGWGHRKGLDVFNQLASSLGEDYQIVLVGTSEQIEAQLSDKIIAIRSTENQVELAEIYTAADVLVNPTREEVLGLVNIEALACGTPVVTFNSGGSPECISDECGTVVPKDDVEEMKRAIMHICSDHKYTSRVCREQALKFNMHDRFAEYIELYESEFK